MPPSTATQVRPGKPLDGTVLGTSVTPARPTRARPGSRATPAREVVLAQDASRPVAAAARASSPRGTSASVMAERRSRRRVREARRPAQHVTAWAAKVARRLIVASCAAELGSCEPTWTWRASDVQAALRAHRRRGARAWSWEAELRAVVPGPDRLVGVRLDPERHANQHAADTRGSCALDLVLCVDGDRCSGLGCRPELLVRLRVPVDDELLALNPGCTCERELTERRDVRADALGCQELEDSDVRECLRAVEDPARTLEPPRGSRGPAPEGCSRSRRGEASHSGRRARTRAFRRARAPRGRSERSPGRARGSSDFACYAFRLMWQLLQSGNGRGESRGRSHGASRTRGFFVPEIE